MAVVPDQLGGWERREFEITFDPSVIGSDAQGRRGVLPPGEYDAAAGINVRGGIWFAPPLLVKAIAP